MIDSRQKGRTAELKCRDELRKLTKLDWERVPMSGALSVNHKLKGDLYVPEVKIKYCVEVKHYKDDQISAKLLTGTNPMLYQWWEQTVRESTQIDKIPLLIFKYDRSKWFAVFYENFDIILEFEDTKTKYMYLAEKNIYVCLLTDFCKYEDFV